jgi:hypothetical protein
MIGIVLSVMLTIELFLSPSDILHPLANLNVWALSFSFLSVLWQYQAANYEIAKKQAIDKSKYKDSTYYKRLAL